MFQPKKSAFSGFGGFNKAQPSSFDFLANLTNGNKSSITSTSKSDTTVSSTIFTNSSLSSKPSNGLFGSPVSSASAIKPMFGLPSTQSSSMSSMFGGTPATTSAGSSLFTASKADSTVGDSPFKIPVTSNNSDVKNVLEAKNASSSQVTSTVFGVPSTNNSRNLFTDTNKSNPFGTKTISVTNTIQTSSLFTSGSKSAEKVEATDKSKEKYDENTMKYYSKLKGLNISVAEWIKKHVDDNALCILSPIFKDYEKYLKQIQDEFNSDSKKPEDKPVTNVSPFSIKNDSAPPKSTGFSFGSNSINEQPRPAGLGILPPPATTASLTSLFPANTNANGTAPFSFGIGKPFSFSANVQTSQSTTQESNNENEDEDAPPKVDYKPIVEENSVYEKKCKVSVKKDGNFIDKGVGTLYIKKVEENGKHQLLVRANTNLGNVLLNLILGSAIPTQRMGKNNVMMVCIPTPDYKPPPVPILIRVKTTEEADELLETLNKYKT